tara:strand:- start:690 stop:1358 length:669 start_codon:yes stop_codon:yes gene_type:complete
MANYKLPFEDKYVTGEFGTRSKYRIANNLGPHRGVDWARPSGTKIPAVSKGTVALVKWSRILGWVLVHSVWAEGKVWYVGYSHLLEKPTLQVGDKVKTGETIGLCGSSGSASSGPHLHATLGRTKKSVFWGQVYDLKGFIKKQIKNEATGAPKSDKKPAPKVVAPKKAVKPSKAATQAPRSYTVKSGDSYWKIGKSFGIDYRKLQKLNNSKPLHPGDKIRID